MYCSQSPFSLWRTRQVQLFRYLEDKDVFQRHYTRLLARRLIYGQSVSDSGEEAMIGKLKVRAALAWRRRCAWEWAPGLLLPVLGRAQAPMAVAEPWPVQWCVRGGDRVPPRAHWQMVCGLEYTAKLQRMFQDVSLSHDLTTSFRSDGDGGRADVDVMVLTSGSWPVQQSATAMTCSDVRSGRAGERAPSGRFGDVDDPVRGVSIVRTQARAPGPSCHWRSEPLRLSMTAVTADDG